MNPMNPTITVTLAVPGPPYTLVIVAARKSVVMHWALANFKVIPREEAEAA